MKRIVLNLFIALPISLFAQRAEIKIDPARTIGEVDPKIYGVFMEPIHFNGRRMGLPDTVDFNTMYGNLYDPSSPLADEHGFRKDYVDAMKELRITNMRWPGGNYAMAYHWQDGIGPKEQRPARINLAWGGTDHNYVGTDEWIELNKAIGSENVVCVNLGLGSIDEARYWVEYCNYKKGTYYSDLRAKYGHEEPYGVKLWDLGNEVDGSPWELGHKSADEYVAVAREAAKAMRAVDNTVTFIASGSSYYEGTGQWVEWNRKVLSGLGDMIGYISIHRYWENSSDYYTHVGDGATDFEEKIKTTSAEIEAVTVTKDFRKPIYISVDEWGSFGRNFLSVLAIAQSLNSFIRHADVVKMANFTLMTGLLNIDREKGTYKTPLFNTFRLFSNNCRGSSVDTHVECDTFNTDKFKGISFLDATAVYSKDAHAVYINVVNRHKEKPISTDIICVSGTFTGKAEAKLITVASLDEPFTFENHGTYDPVSKEFKVEGNKFSYSFPAHSFTQIKVEVGN